MIKPVVQVTEAIAKVARGDTNLDLPTVGPLEINALSVQVNRVKEYLEENKRVDDELRNKMFMLRRSNKEMEVSTHSKAEFLAFICQEMRAPVNSAMGCAQVMKDQIYGPIENKKYRQYASDIYASCNHVISQLDYVLELANIEAHYAVLRESTIDLPSTINRAVRALSDRLQAAHIDIKTDYEDSGLLLFADDFRVQQMVSNTLIFLIDSGLKECTITITIQKVADKKDRHNLQLSFLYPDIRWENEIFNTQLELIRRLAELHQGNVEVTSERLVIHLPDTRLRFAEV